MKCSHCDSRLLPVIILHDIHDKGREKILRGREVGGFWDPNPPLDWECRKCGIMEEYHGVIPLNANE